MTGATVWVTNHDMSEGDAGLGDVIRRRVEARLNDLETTPIRAATRAGLHRDAIRSLFRKKGTRPRTDTLRAIARALDTSTAYLLGEVEDPAPDAAKVSLRPGGMRPGDPTTFIGDVQSGTWRDFDLFFRAVDTVDNEEFLPISVQSYCDYFQFAARIAGPEMDYYYAVGDYLIMVPTVDIDPRVGDHVLVHRSRQGLMEYSIRELRDEGGRLVWAFRGRADGYHGVVPVEEKVEEADDLPLGTTGIVIALFRQVQRPNERARVSLPEIWGRRHVIPSG